MTDGFGVFSYGVGARSLRPCGKSRFLNDLILPDHQTNHRPFIEDDVTAFSSGHVDVFFDKTLKPAQHLVVMDG